MAPARRSFVVRAAFLVPLVRAGLWLLPFGRLRALVSRPPKTTVGGNAPQIVADVVWSVVAVSRRVPRASCLTQALVAERMLADAGIAVELRVGVARDVEGAFEAHAWLEHEGRIVLGEVEGMERFMTLTRRGSAR